MFSAELFLSVFTGEVKQVPTFWSSLWLSSEHSPTSLCPSYAIEYNNKAVFIGPRGDMTQPVLT